MAKNLIVKGANGSLLTFNRKLNCDVINNALDIFIEGPGLLFAFLRSQTSKHGFSDENIITKNKKGQVRISLMGFDSRKFRLISLPVLCQAISKDVVIGIKVGLYKTYDGYEVRLIEKWRSRVDFNDIDFDKSVLTPISPITGKEIPDGDINVPLTEKLLEKPYVSIIRSAPVVPQQKFLIREDMAVIEHWNLEKGFGLGRMMVDGKEQVGNFRFEDFRGTLRSGPCIPIGTYVTCKRIAPRNEKHDFQARSIELAEIKPKAPAAKPAAKPIQKQEVKKPAMKKVGQKAAPSGNTIGDLLPQDQIANLMSIAVGDSTK